DSRRSVPIFFLNKIDEADQSFSVADLLALNRHVTENHRHMSEVAPELEVIYSVLQKRTVLRRKGDRVERKESDKIRATKRLRAYLNEHLYLDRTDTEKPVAAKR